MGSVKNETTNNVQTKNNVDAYGRVILTLKNCLLPEEKLSPTPSQVDGLDAETETDLRILGCELIQTAGILLKLPQVAMATAQVLFHRFYYSKSFVRQNFEITGMGCLYLASKIEEAPRRIRDVINVYHHIKQVNSQKTITPMLLDQNYITLKYQVIKAERRVLKELGFCVHVKHPHKLIVLYLQVLGLETKNTLMQMAWNYMNDSLRTDVFVRYQPETVACACIYLTARKLKIVLPKTPPWFAIFQVEENDIQDVCLRILKLYSRPKPKFEVLEKKVQELCKKFEENRLRNKSGLAALSGTNTPTSPSVPDKKQSPKRRSHSDRSKSRSPRSPSVSPRHKKYKKHKKSNSRSRSRSRSYEKKYKKGYKNSRRTPSPSPAKRDKRYRSRSRSYDREHVKGSSDGKYYSDRYREEKGYGDKYHKEDKYKKDREDDKYKKEDEKHKNDRRDEDRYKKEKKIEENNKHKEENHKNHDDDDRKMRDRYREKNPKYEEKNSKYEEKNSKYEEKNSKYEEKNSKYEEKEKDRHSSKDKHKNSRLSEEDSKKDKYENDRKRKSRRKSEEDDDDVEIISVKKDKKVR